MTKDVGFRVQIFRKITFLSKQKPHVNQTLLSQQKPSEPSLMPTKKTLCLMHATTNGTYMKINEAT